MIYVRATIDPDNNEIKLIEAYERPLTSRPPQLTWCTAITVEVGAFDDDVFPEGVSVAQFLLDRLEFHPGSGTLRTRAGVTDLPTAYATPATLQGLKTRLDATGKQHNIHSAVQAHLRELLASRDDSKVAHLHALGVNVADLRSLPRFKAIEAERTAARAAELHAKRIEHEASKREARITRKLEQSK
jgi:hypothetical protein